MLAVGKDGADWRKYMNSGLIRQDVDAFQLAVRKLSGEIGKASSLWSDAKFFELSAVISVIANISRDVIVTGDKCCSSIDKFAKISEEHY